MQERGPSNYIFGARLSKTSKVIFYKYERACEVMYTARLEV